MHVGGLERECGNPGAPVDFQTDVVEPPLGRARHAGRAPVVLTRGPENTYEPVNSISAPASWVASHPDRLAVAGGGARWSYRDLDLAAQRWADGLAARGVSRGDRVAHLSRVTPDAVA